MTVNRTSEIEKLIEYLSTHILHYHDKEGRTTDEQVFHKARFRELAEVLAAEVDAAVRAKITGETSDGYHTFNELYDHRVLLWINLCLLQHPSMTYLVENHFDGWFLLGCETPHGQLSYHCPNKYLHLVENIRRRHPEFDGHTSADVIKRLEALARLSKLESEK